MFRDRTHQGPWVSPRLVSGSAIEAAAPEVRGTTRNHRLRTATSLVWLNVGRPHNSAASVVHAVLGGVLAGDLGVCRLRCSDTRSVFPAEGVAPATRGMARPHNRGGYAAALLSTQASEPLRGDVEDHHVSDRALSRAPRTAGLAAALLEDASPPDRGAGSDRPNPVVMKASRGRGLRPEMRLPQGAI